MADEGKKIIADDDWKEQARREKERLAEQEAATAGQQVPEVSLADLINLIAIQAMVGLGMMASPAGERIPPNLEIAKHFIDLLAVLQDKTKNNLTEEEKRTLDMVAYDLRLRFVETLKAGPGAPPPPPPAPKVAPA